MFRSLKTALRNMRRSPYQALVAVVMMTLTFFVAYSFVIMLYMAEAVIQFVETRPQVIAYFEVNASNELLTKADQVMKEKEYVDETKAVTKEEALQIFTKENEKDPLLLELVTAEILPASLEVSAKDIGSMEQIKNDLTAQEGVEEVVYQKDLIDNISYWTKIMRQGGLVLTAVLVTITTLLVFVILSLRVRVKRPEISIMQLLGASMWYIRGPFVYEGMLYGMFGALIGWVASFTLLLYLTPTLVGFFRELSLLPLPPSFLFTLLGAGALIGMSIGIFSSFLAVMRFVRKW